MPNFNAVLVTPDQVERCVDTLFEDDNKIFRIEKDTEDQILIVDMIKRLLADGIAVMTSIVDSDDDNRPIAMYVGYKFPTLKGWIVGLTKIGGQHNHFNKSAEIMAPALDLLITEMEKDGYYKFWMISPEQHHNIRNKIMKRHSSTLGRYQWFDEEVIKRGTLSPTKIFNSFRGTKTVDWTDMVVRLFVLNQSERVDFLRKENHMDYKGTIL